MGASARVDSDDRWIDTARGRLFARRWTPIEARDDAAPIVLLHDSLGCVELWRDFPARLAATSGRRVIAYDRLGFGRSDRHPLPQLPPSFIADEAHGDLQQLISTMQLRQFVLFGHSVGGGMAIAAAAAHPNRCRGLISESAQAFVEDRTLAGIRDAQRQFADPLQRERLRRYHGDKTDWVLSAWIERWLDPAFADWNNDAALRQLHCRTLVLHGTRDEYGSSLQPHRISELAGAGTSLRLLPDCGHVPHREQPEAVLALLQEWLAAVG